MSPVVSAEDVGAPLALGRSRCLQKYLALLENYCSGAVPGSSDGGM
jgi:hypothetical protein